MLPTLYLDEGKRALVILDQTKLPNQFVMLELKTQEEIYEAIKALKVRGAPAIGDAAAIGLYLAGAKSKAKDFAAFYEEMQKSAAYLNSSRPTAVNLSWALKRMLSCLEKNKQQSIPALKELLCAEAKAICAEDIASCHKIGEYGLSLIKPNYGILTHCNAGSLATAKYGTATAPMYLAHESGMNIHVYADETRPLLQGARLTATELKMAGLDVTLLCDNMAASLMQTGKINAVFVGCDRVTKNGDVANKIGTCGVAILAHYYNIPFYVCAPTSTLDLNTPCGKDINIEQRDPIEVTEMWYEKRMVPKDIDVYNPAFDVTEHNLVSAIITERGIVRAPYDKSLAALLR